MTESNIEINLRGDGEVPGSAARIIADNGPQFSATDLKESIRISSTTHV